MLDDLPDIIRAMSIDKANSTPRRIQLQSPDHRAAVRLQYDDVDKVWLLTAFETKASLEAKATADGGSRRARETSSPPGGHQKDQDLSSSPTGGTVADTGRNVDPDDDVLAMLTGKSADAFAVAFYEAMGMRITGESPSGSIPGRMLPRMERRL